MNTFPHGSHPKGSKGQTENVPITPFPAPKTVAIPLAQHVGKAAVPVVSVGDRVKMGQMIGRADGKISAAVFSSVSGTVLGIERRITATGHCQHILIENDGKDESAFLPPLSDPTPAEIVERIEACGIVGMGGAGFPAAVKFSPRDAIDTLILDGAECEPYLTCDYRLMLEQPEKILAGGAIMAKALGLERFTIGVEDNKPAAIEALKRTAQEGNFAAVIVVCRTKYPQGAEKQLIYAVKKRKVPVGKLPASVGCIVSNVQTALAVYRAVKEGVPCYERVLTVSGGGVKKGGNFLVRTGTSYADLLAACEAGEYVKMISGGPMMGFAVESGSISVGKTTGGILLLTYEETFIERATACINCGTCARACPMQLMPMYIDAYIQSGDVAGAEKYGALNCIECGCCVYVCPAHRTILQSVRLAKQKIRERGARK